MISAPANAPAFLNEFARRVQSEIDARLLSIPRVPFFPLADLPSAARYWSEATGQKFTAIIGVEATSGPTICLSDGADWIDLQTGSAVT